jgi:spore germination protein GerM
VKKRIVFLNIALVVVFLAVLAGGCTLFQQSRALDPGEAGHDSAEPSGGESDTAPGGEVTPGEPFPDEATGKDENGAVEARKVKITLYFGDQKAIEDDSPCETGYVRPVVREFPHTTAVLRLALQELIRGPMPGEGHLVKTLPATVEILNLKIENEVAVVDFSEELLTAPDSPGGSLGGYLLMQSLVYTATEFPTVKSVLVTVNGETYSDGHFIWEEPIGREYFSSSG